MSEFPRVTNVTGGPRELSMPWALWDAGGRLAPGERGSWAAVVCGAKYDAEVAEAAGDAGYGAVGVEGSVTVARRRRGDAEGAVAAAEGRRSSEGGSGAVWVRWCLGGVGCEADGRRGRCCEAPPDDLREWGMAAACGCAGTPAGFSTVPSQRASSACHGGYETRRTAQRHLLFRISPRADRTLA